MRTQFLVGDTVIENVEEFTYLGSVLTWDNECTRDVRARIVKAQAVMAGFKTIWKSKQVSYETKISILKTCVFSTAL